MGKPARASTDLAFILAIPIIGLVALLAAQGQVRTGADSLTGWKADAPGVRRHIKPADVPAPEPAKDPETSVGKPATVVPPPAGALPKVPNGFSVQVFASGFNKPRTLRLAPNGDIFLAESGAGRVLVFKAGGSSGGGANPEVFAEGLDRPYGIAFLPPVCPQYRYSAAGHTGVA